MPQLYKTNLHTKDCMESPITTVSSKSLGVFVLYYFSRMNIPNLNLGHDFVASWGMGYNTKGIDVGILFLNVFASLVMSSFGNTKCSHLSPNFSSLVIFCFPFSLAPLLTSTLLKQLPSPSLYPICLNHPYKSYTPTELLRPSTKITDSPHNSTHTEPPPLTDPLS